MRPAVRAVEDDSMTLRLDHFLQDQLPLRTHDAVAAAVQAVGDDVARLHVSQHLGQRQRAIGDVHHHQHAGHIGGFAGALDRFRRIFPNDAGPYLSFTPIARSRFFAIVWAQPSGST